MVKKASSNSEKEKKPKEKPTSEVKAPKKSAPVEKQSERKSKSSRTKEDDFNDDCDVSISKSSAFESPMLASTYDGSQNITNWFMSEKLDGVRCIWNGKNLYSRNGNMFYPPKFFIEDFPKNTYLDGELFMSRKSFSETVSIVKKHDPHDEWSKIKFLVFDAPKINAYFRTRLEQLSKIFEKNTSPYVSLHEHKICSNAEIMENEMNKVVSMDGEGRPHS